MASKKVAILYVAKSVKMTEPYTVGADRITFGGEACINDFRLAGEKFVKKAQEQKVYEWVLELAEPFAREEVMSLYVGIFLSAYKFDKYKKEKSKSVNVSLKNFDRKFVAEATVLQEEIKQVRDWVNEPFSGLDTSTFAKQIVAHATEHGVKAKAWSLSEIKRNKMSGLLAVNKGSVDAPAFVELTYNPANARNKNPVVLVGKGIVFDTGGMNIKTENYMEDMKDDMAGAATVTGVVALAARLNMPVYLKALIPITDNRLNGNALVPGDVFTMMDGTTVEVANTDAEGRLVLADAVCYSQKFKPQLVVTVATLTGAAARALGGQGIAAMQENADVNMDLFSYAGEKTHERVCFFPMWKEYEEELKSEIADIKNCGSGTAGMITAAKFLTYFSKKIPLVHLDIAGVAFVKKPLSPYGCGATGIGVRLLTEFLKQI
ncbi:MAG: leucyl aminopeptidase family protein [Bacteroidales bacterium]|jgi:leucyl aminopeptidase|nr:leucyl aminopeptidase family protein [Bacteroidales bacterium]